MDSSSVFILVVVLAAVASVITLIVRGVSQGPKVETDVARARLARQQLGPLPGIQIRPFVPADRVAWERHWDNYCDFYQAEVPPSVTETTWKRIVDPQFPLWGWGAFTDGGDLVGFAHVVLHPHTWSPKTLAYLEDLYVAPAVRGRNVGYELVSYLWRLAEDRDWGRLYWHTEQTNVRARRLYDRFRPADGYVRYTLNLKP